MKKLLTTIFISSLLLIFTSCVNNNDTPNKTDAPIENVPQAEEETSSIFVGAGDIAGCNYDTDEDTAKLLDNIPGTVFTLGDNAYPNGTASEFTNCYDPTWGRHKERTKPSPGNHDYNTPGATGYFNYFGTAAGDPNKGYYSYDIGDWHAIALNSTCWEGGGCSSSSPQIQWLREDLASHGNLCTVAYMHVPRFSSGHHGSNPSMQPIWEVLYEAGTDVVLTGHDHLYERFAPQDPQGNADNKDGIREFIVGTGGYSLYDFKTPLPNSEARNNTSHGVLKLTLLTDSYEWEFVPIAGDTFTDTGSDICH